VRALALALVQLHAPDGHEIWLNPNEILELHDARSAHREHFAPGAQCLIGMSDGKTVQVKEPCDEVIKETR
jgi:uncharacterized protein YlzI (FlbEa/FlbD family)